MRLVKRVAPSGSRRRDQFTGSGNRRLLYFASIMETHAQKAVFLSYAREDAASARRIAEALRSSGIEVWFDENELRGGDAWDQKIRRQIKECSLFLAMISTHTQERGEGYFRREWKLAAERTHDMAAGMPFIVPVVIDDTPEAGALVPEDFMRVQWTRLFKGLPSPQFVDQVQRLLALPHKPEASTRRAEVRNHAPAPVSRSRFPMWPVVAVCAVGLALVAYLATRQREKAPIIPPKPGADAKLTSAAPAVNDQSIAVLPFANLCDDKGNTAFFSDGMHEDILATLANIRDLRVVSRTSVMEYRDTTKKIPQIARELGVAYILEGSVRRAGNQVRITGQLIRAATDEHLWAKRYDRELTTTDLFGIQAAIATEIVDELKATLTPREQKLVGHKLTESVAAYDLFLKARGAGRGAALPRNVHMRAFDRDVLKKKEALLKAAVLLDAKFAEAWGELAQVHAEFCFSDWDNTVARQDQAKAAIDKAVAQAPDSPDIIRNLGNYYFNAHRDYARAAAEFERLGRLQPNNSEVYFSLGEIQQREAKWSAALASFRKATRLDPGNLACATALVRLLHGGRRWEEAIAEQRRIVALSPADFAAGAYLAELPFHARGSTQEMREWLAARTPEEAETGTVLTVRRRWAVQSGDYAEAIRIYRLQQLNSATSAWITLAAHGDMTGARAAAEQVVAKRRARLETEPNNTDLLWNLGLTEALLGNKDKALQCGRRSVELLPESRDAVRGADLSNKLALIYAWAGETDKAIEEAARLLRTPNSIAGVYLMKCDPWWFPLRKDPRFLALIDDPKNNAPLF